jgi:hypothetical protein
MTDRLQPENIEELLINRIINKTDELNGIKFANCLAVVNRSHSDKHSLGDSDKTEKYGLKKIFIRVFLKNMKYIKSK